MNKCFISHMGLWAITPDFMSQAVSAIQAGTWKPGVNEQMGAYALSAQNKVVEMGDGGRYVVNEAGLATIALSGPLMKGFSKYGGTSTIAARQTIRTADRDSDVEAILAIVDSPGGHVDGTQELYDAIAGTEKPFHAHIDDLAASAALWAISPANSISINRAGHTGSIGVYTVAYDESKRFEEAGIKTHVISSGPVKGAGVPGSEITDEQLAEIQDKVDGMNAHFIQAVADGRNMTTEQVQEIATGAVFNAQKALELGLVDHIRNLDETAGAVMGDLMANKRQRRMRAIDADLRLR